MTSGNNGDNASVWPHIEISKRKWGKLSKTHKEREISWEGTNKQKKVGSFSFKSPIQTWPREV